VVLSGGLLVAGSGTGVPPAEATLVNPFPIIIAKLNQILAMLSTSGGGGNHTLRWDTNNASATRFTVLAAIPGAVLDNNTGLVWEQAPNGTPRNWGQAISYCVNQKIGGTAGWRLPSVVELKSVQDGSLTAAAPFVPAPPFTLSTSNTTPGVQSADYWSAATSAEFPTNAWSVSFINGNVNANVKSDFDNIAWCVRGGMHADAY
jgi:hypothetical protein